MNGADEIVISRARNGWIMRQFKPFSDRESQTREISVAETPAALLVLIHDWAAACLAAKESA